MFFIAIMFFVRVPYPCGIVKNYFCHLCCFVYNLINVIMKGQLCVYTDHSIFLFFNCVEQMYSGVVWWCLVSYMVVFSVIEYLIAPTLFLPVVISLYLSG